MGGEHKLTDKSAAKVPPYTITRRHTLDEGRPADSRRR